MQKKFFMSIPEKMNLHLFDGAGAAGDGGASSASSVSGEGSATSESNGSAGNTQSAQGVSLNGDKTVKQDANASSQDVNVATPDNNGRTQFEKYIKGEGKAYFDERVQKIINQRFKETKTLESNAKAIEPALKTLASIYNVDPTNLKELNEAILNDNRMYEDKARLNGVSVEVQKKFDKMELENQQLRQVEEQRKKDEETRQILDNWNKQAQELQKEFPDFNLDDALNGNHDFYDLVVRGIPIRNAYIAAFPDNYTKKIEKGITDNIRARGVRPSANSSSSSATATTQFNVNDLTPAQRREYINRAARGETITFR